MLILPVVILAIESDDDRAVMTQIYQENQALMYKVAWKYLHNKADVEDVVSDTCRELIKHFTTVQAMERNELRAYIIATVRNISLNLLMKIKREKYVSLDDDTNQITSTLQSTYELPETRILLKDILERTIIAINELSSREQDILYLRIKEECTYEEIARLYKISPENARKIVERDRKKIKTAVYGRMGI